MNNSWELWFKFCKETKRESLLNKLIINLLLENKILPSNVVLDVGCGNGNFTSELKSYAKQVIGIDNKDNRGCYDFDFYNIKFENFNKAFPDVLIFKQSWHLIKDPISFLRNYKNSKVVLIQMLKPEWSTDNRWNQYPYNADKNKQLLKQTREITSYKAGLDLKVNPELLEEMFLEGYTSDLQQLTKEQRKEIYKNYKNKYENNFRDNLQIIIASPETTKVKEHCN